MDVFTHKEFSGKEADAALGRAGITVNKNTVPGETRSPFVTSGVRIGSAALSARGMKEDEFKVIANAICDMFDDVNNEARLQEIALAMKELASNFVIYDRAIY